jgi:hypothetical protein
MVFNRFCTTLTFQDIQYQFPGSNIRTMKQSSQRLFLPVGQNIDIANNRAMVTHSDCEVLINFKQF